MSSMVMIPSTANYDMQGKMYIYVPSIQLQVVAVVSISHLPSSTPSISPRMVNYHDPAVVVQDTCAYAFGAKRAKLLELTRTYFLNVEVLACRGWTLLVCLPRRAGHLLP
jgi:hypothetical protein